MVTIKPFFTKFQLMQFRNINLSYCRFERSREPLLHLDYAQYNKKTGLF